MNYCESAHNRSISNLAYAPLKLSRLVTQVTFIIFNLVSQKSDLTNITVIVLKPTYRVIPPCKIFSVEPQI